jgi:hypothetical protein
MKILNAVPAYGRTYDDDADLLIDYLDGKDFRVVGGSYFSFRDADLLIDDGFTHVDVGGYLFPVK